MEKTGLPVSIVCSPANVHDSTKFIDVLENISDFLDDDALAKTVSAYADKGYDACIHQGLSQVPWNWLQHSLQKNSKSITPKNRKNNYNKVCRGEVSLHSSNAGLEELQSDTKGIARTISDSCIWHQLLCIGGL